MFNKNIIFLKKYPQRQEDYRLKTQDTRQKNDYLLVTEGIERKRISEEHEEIVQADGFNYDSRCRIPYNIHYIVRCMVTKVKGVVIQICKFSYLYDNLIGIGQ